MKSILLAVALMAIGTAAYAQAPQPPLAAQVQGLQALLNTAHQQEQQLAAQLFDLSAQLQEKTKELAAAHSAPEAAPSK